MENVKQICRHIVMRGNTPDTCGMSHRHCVEYNGKPHYYCRRHFNMVEKDSALLSKYRDSPTESIDTESPEQSEADSELSYAQRRALKEVETLKAPEEDDEETVPKNAGKEKKATTQSATETGGAVDMSMKQKNMTLAILTMGATALLELSENIVSPYVDLRGTVALARSKDGYNEALQEIIDDLAPDILDYADSPYARLLAILATSAIEVRMTKAFLTGENTPAPERNNSPRAPLSPNISSRPEPSFFMEHPAS